MSLSPSTAFAFASLLSLRPFSMWKPLSTHLREMSGFWLPLRGYKRSDVSEDSHKRSRRTSGSTHSSAMATLLVHVGTTCLASSVGASLRIPRLRSSCMDWRSSSMLLTATAWRVRRLTNVSCWHTRKRYLGNGLQVVKRTERDGSCCWLEGEPSKAPRFWVKCEACQAPR